MPGDFYGIDASLKNFLKEKKQEFEEQFIKEKKENKLDSKKSMNAFIDNPSRISTMKFLQKRKLVVEQKHLASKNKEQLSVYMYGLYQDNVLSYLLRVGDQQTFEYILKRDVSPLSTNSNDLNALHFAVQLERASFLSYLLEGDFDGFEATGFSDEMIEEKSNKLANAI